MKQDVGCTMLEIRATPEGFILFDTGEQEAIMRFDSRGEAEDLIAELMIAESPELSGRS